jgi:hypothetical protein
MIYSYKQEIPGILPNKIRLSNGLTRTDSSTFTKEELLDAGYVLADTPPLYDPNTQHLNWLGTSWEIVNFSQEELMAKINQEWDAVRAKRDGIINSVEWRLTRALSQQRMGLPVNITVVNLDIYMQALRDITSQPDPYNVTWPVLIEN